MRKTVVPPLINQALRELSGVNGLLVGDWIKSHADEVVTHNSKYEMQHPKDPARMRCEAW